MINRFSWTGRWGALACCLFLGVRALAVENIRVTTWNLEWFPSGKPLKIAPELEEKRISDAAAIIEAINPDVLLIQEVRDWNTCEKLAAAVKSLKYHVATVSSFKEAGSASWQQEAILSKNYADSAWSAPWMSTAAVDPSRGYAFASIKFHGRHIGFYSIHLKSNLIRTEVHGKDAAFNILKREAAVAQLVSHAADLQKAIPDLSAVVVGGDFNTNVDQPAFAKEKTFGIFKDAGFVDSFGSTPLQQRVTHPGKGRYPDATFDYIYLRGIRNTSDPEITATVLSDHWPVTVEVSMAD